MVQCHQPPLLLLCSNTAAITAAAAAAAGESPHWHAGGDLELWSTGTLSQGTRSSLSPFSFFLLVCLYCALPLAPLAQLSPYLLGTSAGGITGVEEPS